MDCLVSEPGPAGTSRFARGGLGCLGRAEHELVDVGQALPDLQGNVDPASAAAAARRSESLSSRSAVPTWTRSGGSPASWANSGDARGVWGGKPVGRHPASVRLRRAWPGSACRPPVLLGHGLGRRRPLAWHDTMVTAQGSAAWRCAGHAVNQERADHP